MPSKIVFVIGRGASGKSYYAQNLNDTTDSSQLLSIDDIIRQCERDFSVYTNPQDWLVEYIRSEMTEDIVIIEGSIKSPELIRLIAGDCSYVIHYCVCDNLDEYYNRVMKRVENDVAFGVETLSWYWHGHDQPVKISSVDIVIANFNKQHDHLALFDDMPIEIIFT